MTAILLATAPIFALLLATELLWRSGRMPTEYSRKIIHITTGSYIAFWPYFLERQQILLLVTALFLTILLSRFLRLFGSIHTVKRPTVGDILFPAAIALAAIFAETDWVFTAAVLHMSLADGLAAVVGTRYGSKSMYVIVGSAKSVVGTSVFIVFSAAITFAALTAFGLPLWPSLLIVPVGAAVLENIGVYGLDNVFVTGFVVLALNAMI